MPCRIVILGGGFAGLELVSRLAEEVPDRVDVTLIDKGGSFVFGFSKLDVLFGRKSLVEVQSFYTDIDKPSVRFRQETIRSIDPSARRVVTDAGTYEADVLVVALGADYDVAATPGLAEGGHEFYSVEGAHRTREVLEAFGGGAVVISVLGPLFKCPGAPNETALMLHDFLSERGRRESSTIHLLTPMPMPIPISKETSAAIVAMLEDRGIDYRPETVVTRLDPGARAAHLASGEQMTYDLFLGIPVHCAPEVVVASGLTEDGWVPVDPRTFATRFSEVYAVGDVTSAPVPRAGGIAEGEASTLADVLIAKLTGSASPPPYGGAAACYMEAGRGTAARIDVNFLSGPSPRAALTGPTESLLVEKEEWGAARRSRWFGSPGAHD